MRLIEIEKVLLIIEEIKENREIPKNYGTLLDIMRKIRQLPTIDAEPVVHGHWEYIEGGIILQSHYKCSACGTKRFEHWVMADFERCPHCGAKMDEEKRYE